MSDTQHTQSMPPQPTPGNMPASPTSSTSSSSADRRRRSSLFSALEDVKRNPGNAERRASLNDQRSKAGFFGSLWRTHVQGSPGAPAAK